MHFECEALFSAADGKGDCDGVENFGHAILWEGGVDDGADDLDDFTVFAHGYKRWKSLKVGKWKGLMRGRCSSDL